MRKRILVLAIVLLASITLWAGTGDRYALVIGNGKYQKTTPLANPPTDATDVAKMLEDVGFMVTLQTDASLSQMEGTILMSPRIFMTIIWLTLSMNTQMIPVVRQIL